MAFIDYSKEIENAFIKAPELKRRIEFVVDGFFPEVENIKFGKASKSAYYDPQSGTVRLTKNSSIYIIGHEITHYLQDKNHYAGAITIPGGERACDLYLFARSPALVTDFWNSRDGSYIGNALKVDLLKKHYSREEGQMMIHETCKGALIMRDNGKRDYIKWAEDTINQRIASRSKKDHMR
ncbi:hypothetical protein CUJ83_09630 [Methanocella sp. CWC-04]|uniref:Uncharacterized protein n=1 Tax=Methanooceanicella nereidis TaxID=2052831 RepID=A0AAP2W6E4_9EURY|nr:hypothetical protein [Methanocella sp. CWC-04]MCD1295258.1 hypothetical protein [Methanocella sp. CWC-04]